MTYIEENNFILNSILENGFFKEWRKPIAQKDLYNVPGLELYVTPDCSQNCSYCYLCKYKEELYPQELRNEENIINNLKMVLDYLLENKLNPPRFDLFSGDIWDTEFGWKCLDVLLEAVKKGFKPNLIMIPSNCSFLLDKKAKQEIENRLQEFKDLNVRFLFSCSNDGYYIDTLTRPLNTVSDYDIQKGTKEYYNMLFDFCKKWGFGFHPMVAAHGIEEWSKNYKWWLTSLSEKGFDPLNAIMFLEVRNDDWTEEKIISYLKYLNDGVDFLMSTKITSTHGRENMLPEEIFQKWRTRTLERIGRGHYSPFHITSRGMMPGCTIHRSLVIRLGDLAIVPCHRTSYDELNIGNLKVENNKITEAECKNIQIMNQIWLNNMMGTAKCNYCIYKNFCMKGCYGAQLEANQDMFYPCESVCDLYQARIIFLYHKYKKLNLLNPSNQDDQNLINLIETIKNSQEYKKWTKIAFTII